MITTHLNLFDAGVLGVVALSCLFAFFRGFVREILSLSAWIGAGIVTLYYFPVVAAKLQPHFKNAVIASGFATLGIFIAAMIVFAMINIIILKFLKSGSEIGLIDNIFGLLFGAFRGAFIVSLGFFLVTIVMPENQYPEWLKDSKTRPYVEKGAIMLAKVAPDYLREISSLEKKMEDKMNNGDTITADEEKEKMKTYTKETNARLQRLIDSAEQGQQQQ
jgi:membrane protein required for colicin V production